LGGSNIGVWRPSSCWSGPRRSHRTEGIHRPADYAFASEIRYNSADVVVAAYSV